MWIFLKLQNWRLYFFFYYLTPILGFRNFSYLAMHASDIYFIYMYFILKEKIAKWRFTAFAATLWNYLSTLYIRTSIVPFYMFFLICWCACMFNWFLNRQSLCYFTWQTQKKKERKKRANQSNQNKQLNHVRIEFLQS